MSSYLNEKWKKRRKEKNNYKGYRYLELCLLSVIRNVMLDIIYLIFHYLQTFIIKKLIQLWNNKQKKLE